MRRQTWTWFRRAPLTLLDLRGAAEMANGIEKCGHFGYMMKTQMEFMEENPRTTALIVNIGVPVAEELDEVRE